MNLATTPARSQLATTSPAPDSPQTSSFLGLSGRLLLFLLRVLPSILYWSVTFTTITLPTWLFTLFSTSLTFTMNFTTL